MLTRNLLLTVLIAAYASIQFSGCSLISFGIGAAIDGSSPDEYVFTASGVDSIKRGSSIEVLRVDSSIVSGDFQGKGFAASEDYALRYKQFINSLPIGMDMPALGDSIFIVKHGASGRKTLSGVLLGFDTGVMRVDFPGWNDPASVLVEAIDTIRYNNSTFLDGDVLRNLMSAGQVPFNSAIIIATTHGSQAIPLGEILEVRQPIPHNAKWYCLGLGAVLDVVGAIYWAATFTLAR
jgi:hypothetical protein